MVLRVKNMVCDRCILAVRQQLTQLSYEVQEIQLGRVQISPNPTPSQLSDIEKKLQILGFELIDDEKEQYIEIIKNAIIEMVHYADISEKQVQLPELLSEKIHRDYGFLSKLFSETEGITIEKFLIQQKVEKIKELLEYGELSIKEIAYKMGYSSSAHLSSQFKSVTGLSPSHFDSNLSQRKSIDNI